MRRTIALLRRRQVNSGLVALILGITTLLLLSGCAGKHVVRNRAAFEAEVLAAMKRQQEAADALFVAAEYARSNGDLTACQFFATPALLIEAAAQAHALRALHLAGILPQDPGGMKPIRPVSDVCGEPA